MNLYAFIYKAVTLEILPGTGYTGVPPDQWYHMQIANVSFIYALTLKIYEYFVYGCVFYEGSHISWMKLYINGTE